MNPIVLEVTGWGFIAATAMLWLGWVLLPVKLGTFIAGEAFVSIHRVLYRWIWLFRIHLFGYLVTMMAFVALGTLADGALARAIMWPAIAVVCAGLIVSALAQAFYYHFGAWGAVDMHDKTSAERAQYVKSLDVSTHYVTCLVRFGRVFYGLGLAIVAVGLHQSGLLPGFLAVSAGILGVAAMAVTMGFPDNLEYYGPLFHLNALWLAAAGAVLIAV